MSFYFNKKLNIGGLYVRNSLPELETERLILRRITENDLHDMNEYGGCKEVSQFVSWETHQSLEDTKTFLDLVLQGYAQGESYFWGLILKENNKLIGTINYVTWNQKHRVGEIGYVLSNTYWRRGLMTEAATEVIRFGFREGGLVRIQAKCFLENTGSEGVMKKCGMTYEGTLRQAMYAKGKQHDLKLYAIIKNDDCK